MCDYITNSSKGLKCHVAKKHKIEIVRESSHEKSLELSINHEPRDADDLDLNSDEDVQKCELNCFNQIAEDKEIMMIPENILKCEECHYENADMAELIIHVAKVHNNCKCCETKLRLIIG